MDRKRLPLPVHAGAVSLIMVKRTMKKSEMKVYKERLLQLRSRLRGDVSAMAENALRRNRGENSTELSSMPLHMADVGTDNFEQEFTLSLMANEEGRLHLIEAALERIEDGGYGSCDECGAAIPKLRLNAIPYTPFCVKCAEKMQS
jgi:RNA polymerase-binding transcription factor DksA